jgi:hypothetical protein
MRGRAEGLQALLHMQSGLTVGIVGGSDLVKISEQLGADGEDSMNVHLQ